MIESITVAKVSGAIAGGLLFDGVLFAMTDAVAISIATNLSAVLMAGLAAYFAYKSKTTSTETHKLVNSRMTEFMEMAKKSYTAEGKLAGRVEGNAEGKAEQKEIQQQQ